MKKNLKKALSMLLMIVMLLNCCPIAVFAGDEDAHAMKTVGSEPRTEGRKHLIGLPSGDRLATSSPVGDPQYGEMTKEASAYEFEPDVDPTSLSGQITASTYDLFDESGENWIELILLKYPEDSSELLAGNTLVYGLRYKFPISPVWANGYNTAMTLYDTYENCALTITLPKELKLSLSPSSMGKVFFETEKSGDNIIYRFKIGDDNHTIAANAEYAVDFTFLLYIEGNGTSKAIAEYDLSEAISLSTDFTVKNKQDLENQIDLITWNQAVTIPIPDIDTTTPDVWGVEKTPYGVPTLSADKTKTTVQYVVKVGLLDDDGEIITDPDAYNRYGRDPVDTMILTEQLSHVINNTRGTTATPTELTLLQ